MKQHTYIAFIIMLAVLIPLTATPAHALSCLPVDMYLADIVGKDDVVVFVGTANKQIKEKEHTIEVITVTEVKQGYVEDEIFVYHQKSDDWGYFCNAGPALEKKTSVYVASRDAYGKYMVHQRLELNDKLVTQLESDLETAEVVGEVVDITKTDRMNQIITTITDLVTQIKILLSEYSYLKAQK